MGRHAKRTTVKRLAVGLGIERWIVELATFDKPSTAVAATREEALDIAHRFERLKARGRFIDAARPRRSYDAAIGPIASALDRSTRFPPVIEAAARHEATAYRPSQGVG